MKNINTLNKLETHITPPGDTRYGTRFDKMLPILEYVGYKDGWNKTGCGMYVWFKHVGCAGYEFIPVTKRERVLVIKRARRLMRQPVCWAPRDYWSYMPEDSNYAYPNDNGTCTRNLRLVRKNRLKFLAHLVSSH
jgi:hypothetical protein